MTVSPTPIATSSAKMTSTADADSTEAACGRARVSVQLQEGFPIGIAAVSHGQLQ